MSCHLLKPNVANSLLFNFCEKKSRSTWPDNDLHWPQRPFLGHFRRKMIQLCFWNKIRTAQWLALDSLAFQCMCAGFLCPKCDNFACLHTRQDKNELYLKRRFFLPKSASSKSRSQPDLTEQKHIGFPIGFNSWINWTLYIVSEMLHFWEWRCIYVDGASRTLSATAAICLGVRIVFGFYGLVYRWGCQFLSLFHKIKNIRSWRLFSSSKIRT